MQRQDRHNTEGATKRRKRVGRGTGSGKGKTSGRGTKGQLSRTGASIHAAFEGGQNSMTKRLPKMRGFNNRFKVEYVPVNLDALERLFEAGDAVSPETLALAGLLGNDSDPVVVLARGEVTKPLHIKVHRMSAQAKGKIEAAGGTVEMLPYAADKNLPRS